MTEKELETIVARHEMQQLELKESFGAEAIESACAFTNAHGGYIVIGVDNSSRPKINFIIIGKTLGFLDYFFDVSCTDFGV